MTRTALLVRAAALGVAALPFLALDAAAQGRRARPVPRAPEPVRETYLPVGRVLLAGASAPLAVDPRREIESIAIDWIERFPGSRAAVVLDGRAVAHRFVGGREHEEVALDRRASSLAILVERGRVLLRGVHVRYAPARAVATPPRVVLRDGPLARRAVFQREVRGAERLVVPGEATGLFVDEVRVRASARFAGARLRLEVPGLFSQERLVTGAEVLRFELPRGLRADADLFLTSDLRGVRVDEVRVLLERRVGARDGRGRDDDRWREGRRSDRFDFHFDDDDRDDEGRRGRGRRRD